MRRHSISIDSFLSEAALTADDELEDMYREEAAAPRSAGRRAASSSPEPPPVRPPRGRLRSRSMDAPPPALGPRRPRLSGGSLADIVEADAEEEAEDRRRRRRRGRTRAGEGGGGVGGRSSRRLSLDVTALGLTRSRRRSVVSPTADGHNSDRSVPGPFCRCNRSVPGPFCWYNWSVPHPLPLCRVLILGLQLRRN